jgi:hypothetical protein
VSAQAVDRSGSGRFRGESATLRNTFISPICKKCLPAKVISLQLSRVTVPLRLLPAPFHHKRRVAGGKIGIGLPASIRRSAVSATLQPQVIAVMQNTKSARLMWGRFPHCSAARRPHNAHSSAIAGCRRLKHGDSEQWANGRWRASRSDLWLTFGPRASLLTGKPFRATSPGNALLN